MAAIVNCSCSIPLLPQQLHSSIPLLLLTPHHFPSKHPNLQSPFKQSNYNKHLHFRLSYRFSPEDCDEEDEEDCNFDAAVFLFNNRDYYRCHDYLESLWNKAEEPTRTLIHGILQCAVGLHHLFNQNHRGAMMELGEGLCKLQKMNFESGPFHQFEQEVAASLDFIYQTQLELAACIDDLCLTMDGSERSYQLLGTFAAGQHLYSLDSDPNDVYCIVFRPTEGYNSGKPARIKVPTLHATQENLTACNNLC